MSISVDVLIVNNKINQPFTYMVDLSLSHKIKYGSLVIVNFNNYLEIAYVINIEKNKKYDFEIKPIISILEKEIISPFSKSLINYLDNTLYASKVDITRMILKKNSENRLKLIVEDDEENIINYYQLTKENKKIETINILKDIKNYKFKLKENKIPQMIIYKYQNKYYQKKTLIQELNLTEYMFKKMKNNQEIIAEKINKNEFIPANKNEKIINQLTDYQMNAYCEIKNNIKKKITLLQGVTGSGKTAIFIKLINDYIQNNQQVLILVPEVTLTQQMIETLNKYYPNQCAFFNNSLISSERNKLIQKINNMQTKIIIGTRSSIFLEIKNLGLVIIDEEHDKSYKQNFYPYYHVDIMFDFWQKNNINILLSSATPRLITKAKAEKSIYKLVELKERYNNYNLPKIKYEEYNNDEIISSKMIAEIKYRLSKDENILVLFNVTGYSKIIECSDCGEVLKCPHCNISLKYFKSTQQFKCSYCNYQINNKKCPKCSSTKLHFLGFGIEKIQEILSKKLPNINILRVDSKLNNSKNKIHETIKKFKEGKKQILIGTQIIAKGINFPNLKLVIVLNTDNMLYYNDFNSNEYAYQLLEQISGRSGRDNDEGEVLIYTNHQDNFVYKAVEEHNYNAFYQKEMYNRKLQKTNPYYFIAMVEYRHKNTEKCIEFINILKYEADNMNLITTNIVIPYIEAIENKTRRQIFIKYKKENIKNIIEKLINNITTNYSLKINKNNLLIDLNVDSYNL